MDVDEHRMAVARSLGAHAVVWVLPREEDVGDEVEQIRATLGDIEIDVTLCRVRQDGGNDARGDEGEREGVPDWLPASCDDECEEEVNAFAAVLPNIVQWTSDF